MKKQLFDLTIEEFTRLLLDYPKQFKLQMNAYKEDGSRMEREPDFIVGSYEELNSFAENYAPNHPIRTLMQNALNTLFDYNMGLNMLDIYNYLEHATSHFQKERIYIVLEEMECFYFMDYIENINADVLNQYIEKGWKIPRIEIKLNKKAAEIEGKEVAIDTDYGAMRGWIYPFREYMYYQAIGLLKSKMQSEEPTNPIVPDNLCEKGRTMKITTDVLVELLNKTGINENNSDKTKIAKLISYITGFSENTIRQRLSNKEELTSNHKDEIERINKILSGLNTGISIKYNKNR